MNKSQRPIILASGSPRRRELLAGLGLDFQVISSDVSEEVTGIVSPAEMVELLALRKAEAVSQQVEAGLVIGSDTIVVLNEEILGKPNNEDEAFEMLSKLQGNTHQVFSGVAVIDVEQQIHKVGHQSTEVTMAALTEAEIRQYIATQEPMDKAGSYAIQGIGATLIEGIRGDYFTVVGLPLRLTTQFLKQYGIDILSNN